MLTSGQAFSQCTSCQLAAEQPSSSSMHADFVSLQLSCSLSCSQVMGDISWAQASDISGSPQLSTAWPFLQGRRDVLGGLFLLCYLFCGFCSVPDLLWSGWGTSDITREEKESAGQLSSCACWQPTHPSDRARLEWLPARVGAVGIREGSEHQGTLLLPESEVPLGVVPACSRPCLSSPGKYLPVLSS